MRTSQAARHARRSAAAAFLLAAIVAGVYVQRAWQRRQVRRNAPPPAPIGVEKQSSAFSFSKVDGTQTIFTVTASSATEFRGSGQNILEDVLITIFGRSGERDDRIHTKSCEYHSKSGRILCTGDVRIDLKSAGATRGSILDGGNPENVVHIATRKVAFNRETGEAQTDQDVRIDFPQGTGRGTGVSYDSASGIVHVEKNVELNLIRLPAEKAAGASNKTGESQESASLKVTGSRLEYFREGQVLRLGGPVSALQGNHELTAATLELELDAKLHARKLVALSGNLATQRPEVRTKQARGNMSVSADRISVRLHPRGWMEKVEASGAVRGSGAGPAGEEQLLAGKAELDMTPKTQQPAQLTASEKVFVETKSAAGGIRQLRTERLFVRFAPVNAGHGTRIARMETLAPGTLEWHSGKQEAGIGVDSTRLTGQKIRTKFGGDGRPQELVAQGGAEVQRQLTGKPLQTTSSKELRVKFTSEGDWTEMNFSGDVKLKEGERVAQSDQAQMTRAKQTAVLTGNAVASDATTRTTAQRISFAQATGQILAEGRVRSSDLATGRSAVNLAPAPAHISAAQLTANSGTGRALYSGKARLWQGDSVLEADSIELQKDTNELHAEGNVLGEFPQASGRTAVSPKGRGKSDPSAARPGSAPVKRWRVRAGTLTYWGKQGRAHLDRGVVAKSEGEEMSAAAMDFYFSAEGGVKAQQLSRAVARGNVVVREGERRGTAQNGEYTAEEEKFVLVGGNPTLTDAFGTTTGRQLTFFLADDTIIVDSENGSRTLTRHRVEK